MKLCLLSFLVTIQFAVQHIREVGAAKKCENEILNHCEQYLRKFWLITDCRRIEEGIRCVDEAVNDCDIEEKDARILKNNFKAFAARTVPRCDTEEKVHSAQDLCQNRVLDDCGKFLNKLYCKEWEEDCRYASDAMRCVDDTVHNCNVEKTSAISIKEDIRELIRSTAPDCAAEAEAQFERDSLTCQERIDQKACKNFVDKMHLFDEEKHCEYTQGLTRCVDNSIRNCRIDIWEAILIQDSFKQFTDAMAPNCTPEQHIPEVSARKRCESEIVDYCEQYLRKLWLVTDCGRIKETIICVNGVINACDIEEKDAKILKNNFKAFTARTVPRCDTEKKTGPAKWRCQNRILDECDKLLDKLNSNDLKEDCGYVSDVVQCVDVTVHNCNIDRPSAVSIKEDFKGLIQRIAPSCTSEAEAQFERDDLTCQARIDQKDCKKLVDKMHLFDEVKHCEYARDLTRCVDNSTRNCRIDIWEAISIQDSFKQFTDVMAPDCISDEGRKRRQMSYDEWPTYYY